MSASCRFSQIKPLDFLAHRRILVSEQEHEREKIMGYFEDVYSSPENYGLAIVGEIEWSDESYQFDMTVLWVHGETKILYVGSDSGCSCPSPFEDVHSLEDLTKISKPMDLYNFLAEAGEDHPNKVGDVGELIMKARDYF